MHAAGAHTGNTRYTELLPCINHRFCWIYTKPLPCSPSSDTTSCEWKLQHAWHKTYAVSAIASVFSSQSCTQFLLFKRCIKLVFKNRPTSEINISSDDAQDIQYSVSAKIFKTSVDLPESLAADNAIAFGNLSARTQPLNHWLILASRNVINPWKLFTPGVFKYSYYVVQIATGKTSKSPETCCLTG